MGFTFDDTDKKGIASTIADMKSLVEKNPRNAERIFPYVGGEDINDSPTHEHHRYVINFADFPLRRKDHGHDWGSLNDETQRQQLREGVVAPNYPGSVAADWPDLLAVVEQRVKPERDKLSGNPDAEHRRKFYWRWARYAPTLQKALEESDGALCISRVSQHVAFCWMPNGGVAAETIVLLTLDRYKGFSILQSRPHEIWARLTAATLEDRFRYTPTDCFETFPMPVGYESNERLEETGRAYYELRSALMIHNKEGLTKIYNRFHRPDEQSAEIIRLRALHDAVDRSVLDAYGWTDLQPVCQFFPEFDEDEDDDETGSGRKKKKKYRYRWSDEIQDDVLARLLILSRERATLEGDTQEDAQEELPRPTSKRKSKASNEPKLF
jgi:hypothetical protein